jgi:hypothetical protein
VQIRDLVWNEIQYAVKAPVIVGCIKLQSDPPQEIGECIGVADLYSQIEHVGKETYDVAKFPTVANHWTRILWSGLVACTNATSQCNNFPLVFCGLAFNERGNGTYRIEIADLQIIVRHDNAELLFQPRDKLHVKQGIDVAARKNIILVTQRLGNKKSGKKTL